MQNTKEFPLVTIIIPAYNHENYVGQTIQSMLDQTYKNIELIIINDGSSDMTHEEILKYIPLCEERFVRFEYRSRENRGLSATLNEMILWSQGKYISVCASDDMFLKDKIEILVQEFEKLDDTYAVVCGDATFIDDEGRNIELEGIQNFVTYYVKNRTDIFDINLQFGHYKTLIRGNYIPAMSTIIRKDFIYDVGLYTESIAIEDWDMWLKLSKKYQFKYINRVVANYRWHESNSVKTMASRLLRDSLLILLKEREFSYENGYVHLWIHTYLGIIKALLLLTKNLRTTLYFTMKIITIKEFPILVEKLLFKLKNVFNRFFMFYYFF